MVTEYMGKEVNVTHRMFFTVNFSPGGTCPEQVERMSEASVRKRPKPRSPTITLPVNRGRLGSQREEVPSNLHA